MNLPVMEKTSIETTSENGRGVPVAQGLVPALAALTILGLSGWAAFALIRTVAVAAAGAAALPFPGL